MKGHTPRHRAIGPAARALRRVRWLRVMPARQSTAGVLEPDVARRAGTPDDK